MNTKNIPALVTLSAALVAMIIMIKTGRTSDIFTMLVTLLVVLISFYIVGCIIKVIFDKVFKEIEEDEELTDELLDEDGEESVKDKAETGKNGEESEVDDTVKR